MTRAVIALFAAGLAVTAARADRLHLAGGGIIETDRWWIDGETVHVESHGGTVGLPRTILVRVERSSSTARPQALATAPPPSGRPVPAGADDRTARMMHEGNEALGARDHETASRRFHEVIRERPDAAGPRVGFAVAEMALGRDASALPVILDGLARSPDAARLHEVLGELRDREERVEDALAAWREAFRLAPTDRLRDRIEKAERELSVGRRYAFSAAAHFNVRYDGDIDQDLVASIIDALEARYGELTSVYRHAPGQPITVLLYPREAFHEVTRSGESVAGLFDGKIRVPLGGVRSLSPQAERVLAHELTHAIVQSKTRGNCPRWLHEGLAQIAEARPLTRSDRIGLGRAVSDDSPATWPDAAFSYPGALALTTYLEGLRGFDALVSVLDRLGDGDSLDTALAALYGRGYDESARAWARTLRADGS